MNIALLLSGGVDSAVACHLLMEQGIRPDLFYIKIGMDGDDELTCTAEEDLEMCRAIAHRYRLPLEVVDLQKEYWDRVVTYTMDHVRHGLTPNPDVMCNRLIKFGAFDEKVGHAYDRLCTGHYARCIRDNEVFCDSLGGESMDLSAHHVWLGTAPDPVKDQTDFLAQLDPAQVEKIMLPLGNLPKADVRRIAEEAHLAPAHRKDSQGICFLGKINYSDFVRRFLGTRTGDVIEIETGKKVGEHQGYWFHTIGQRKGLGLGGGPWFVVKKDLEQNILYVSHGYDTLLQYGRSFDIAGFHFLTGDPWPAEGTFDVTFKIRHTDRWRTGRLTRKRISPANPTPAAPLTNPAPPLTNPAAPLTNPAAPLTNPALPLTNPAPAASPTPAASPAPASLPALAPAPSSIPQLVAECSYHIDGDAPIQGIAPGQFAVVYSPDGRICFGSGEIAVSETNRA